MDFQFTEEQLMIRDAARDFAAKLIDDVIERDTHGTFPEKHIETFK